MNKAIFPFFQRVYELGKSYDSRDHSYDEEQTKIMQEVEYMIEKLEIKQ